MVPKILVIGGTGFIGENVLTRAISLGWESTSLSLSKNLMPGVRSLQCDIMNSDHMSQLLKGEKFDYIVNCSGHVNHGSYFEGGRDQINFHFFSLLNIINNIDRTNLRSFVNLGSGDEYGGAEAPQSERLREMPNSPYSMGKVAGAHFLQMLHRTEGFPAITLRIFLTYGPGQRPNRLIPQTIQACLENSKFPTSTGNQVRDFCYIDDVVDAIFASLAQSKAQGRILNVGSGEPVSVKDVILQIKRMIGSGDPQFGGIEPRFFENSSLYPDLELIREVINWFPKISLEEGLARTISSYRQND